MTVFEKIKSFDIEQMMVFLKAYERNSNLIDALYSCNHCPDQELCNDCYPCRYADNWKLQYRGFLNSNCRELEEYLDAEKCCKVYQNE